MTGHVSTTGSPQVIVVGRKLDDGTWRFLAGAEMPYAEAKKCVADWQTRYGTDKESTVFVRAADDPELEQYERSS